MGVELFKIPLALGQDGNTAAADVDPFRNMLLSIGDPAEAAGRIDVQALVSDPTPGVVMADVRSGALNFAYGSPTGSLSGSLADHLTFTHEFGMEVAEMISWWFEGGG